MTCAAQAAIVAGNAKRKKIVKNRRITTGKLYFQPGLFAYFIYTDCSFSALPADQSIPGTKQLLHLIKVLRRDYNGRFNGL